MRRFSTAAAILCTVSLICAAQEKSGPDRSKLTNPASLTEKAPDKYQAQIDTTKGSFVVEVTRAWAPNGADRFFNLVKNGYFDDCAFFRAVAGFMVQFGINGNPRIHGTWTQARIQDDPVKQSNKKGTITFAMAGPNTRTTQVFINLVDNSRLDSSGFAPFGRISDAGMKVVESLYTGYGDFPSFGGKGPDPTLYQTQGNAYLQKAFPKMDYMKTAVIVNK